MEPFGVLGVTASIIACLQLSQSLLKRIGPSDHTKSDLNHTLQTLCAFQGAYEGVKAYLEHTEEDETRLSTLQSLEEPLQSCKLALDFIQDRLKNVNFIGQHLTGIFWDGKLKKHLKRLKDAKELLDLALHADQ